MQDNLDKQVTIFLIEEDNYPLYITLKLSGNLNRLSNDELMHIYASTADTYEDVSDVPDYDISPVSHELIQNVISKVRKGIFK